MEPEQFEDAVGQLVSLRGNEKGHISVFFAAHLNRFGMTGFEMLGNILATSSNVTVIKAAFRLLFFVWKISI